ncbi:MAG: universal stress protein [Planctomycetes bacterium]|nr:universal stress protein [Planctomycetota bacterium]NUQ33882.1 universal stress protein [Planctomycetaceae bacterium]
MNKIEKFLVATDLTDQGTKALEGAARLAKKYSVTLLALHVVEGFDERYEFVVDDINKKLEKDAEAAFADAVQPIERELQARLRTSVKSGSPLEKIIGTQLEEQADVLVVGVGSGDAGAIESGRLGPIARTLAHTIPASMLFVRGKLNMPLKNILVATDFSDCAADALRRAIELAKLHGVDTLTVVHAYSVPAPAPRYYKSVLTDEQLHERMRQFADRRFNEWIKPVETHGITIRPVLLKDAASKAIADQAKAVNADLVVIGTHGRTSSSSVLLGSVAERVVRDAPCSVWAERMPGRALGFARAISRIMGVE